MGKVSGALEGEGRWHLQDLYHFRRSLWKWKDSPSVLPEMSKYSSLGHVVTLMDLPSSPALYHKGLHPRHLISIWKKDVSLSKCNCTSNKDSCRMALEVHYLSEISGVELRAQKPTPEFLTVTRKLQ